MKPSDPIYFGEITDGIVTNDEDNKNDKNKDGEKQNEI